MRILSPNQRCCRTTGWDTFVSIAVLLAFFSLSIVPTGWAQTGGTSSADDQGQGTPSGAGIQAASAVCTILYFPFKAAFAIGGGIVGGLAYAFSGGSETTAKSIWTTSMYGTYIITPEHLKGDKPVRFLGVAAESDGAPRVESSPDTTQIPAPEPVR
ncbi:MAG: hypothetical protein ACT4OO_09475 [Nitrospiraceae bacterium]